MMTKDQASRQVAEHVVATLPEAVGARLELLDAVLEILPRDLPCADPLLLMRHHLFQHEAMRMTCAKKGAAR